MSVSFWGADLSDLTNLKESKMSDEEWFINITREKAEILAEYEIVLNQVLKKYEKKFPEPVDKIRQRNRK